MSVDDQRESGLPVEDAELAIGFSFRLLFNGKSLDGSCAVSFKFISMAMSVDNESNRCLCSLTLMRSNFATDMVMVLLSRQPCCNES